MRPVFDRVQIQIKHCYRPPRLLLVLACSVCFVSPVSALAPDYRLSQYVHTAWTSDAGLQSVRRVKQTADGYLWLATRGGLVRFDGVRFKTFAAGPETGLESSTVQDLVLDRDGSLWVATLGGGIAHYRDGKFRSYSLRDGLPSDDVSSLFVDSRGVLWIGTRDGKVASRAQGRFEIKPWALSDGPITTIVEDADAGLWISTFGDGVYHLREGVLTAYSVKDGLPDVRVSQLHRDRSGKLWTAGWQGLSWWNGTRFVPEQTVNASVSYAIGCTEDRDGNLWIASSTGLVRAHDGKLAQMDRDDGLSGDFVSDVFEDREGNIWIATRGGLDRLYAGPVRTFSDREGLFRGSGPVLASGGAVWTISGTRIARIAGNEISTWNRVLPAGSRPATLLARTGSTFLIGLDNGAVPWGGRRGTLPRELKGLDIVALFSARDGSLWIATANRGLLHWSGSAGAPIVPRVSDNLIGSLAEDGSGAIWAGTISGAGVYRVTPDKVEQFGRAEGLRSPIVYTVFVDGQNRLWVGSTGGLSWLENGRFRTASSLDGLPSNQVFAVVDDNYGRLWLAGYGGIASVEKKSFAEWVAGKRSRLTPTVYRAADGLQPYSASRTFPNAVRSENGHLWFSTAAGVLEVTPSAPGSSIARGFQVLIEDVAVDGVAQSGQELLRVAPGTRSIEFNYTALALTRPETLQFRYRLQESDRDWIHVDSRRVAFYSNLKPGKYTFRVAASAGEEQWVEAPALMLEQLPFFYQTPWFALLTSSALLSLIFFAYRLRVQQEVDRIQAGFQERLAERTRIAQELHDTVVQAIAGSTMLVETAADKVPDSLPVVKGALLRALDGLDQALAESRTALQGLRNSTGIETDLGNELAAVAQQANERQIDFKLVITGELRPLRTQVQYEVLRIGSEAIGNAFRHSGASAISVDLEYFKGLRLSVKDNGNGIPEEVLHRGRDGHFGLQVMRERAERIGARLAVYSRAGEGTEVGVTIPHHVAYDDAEKKTSRLGGALSKLKSFGRRTSSRPERGVEPRRHD